MSLAAWTATIILAWVPVALVGWLLVRLTPIALTSEDLPAVVLFLFAIAVVGAALVDGLLEHLRWRQQRRRRTHAQLDLTRGSSSMDEHRASADPNPRPASAEIQVRPLGPASTDANERSRRR